MGHAFHFLPQKGTAPPPPRIAEINKAGHRKDMATGHHLYYIPMVPSGSQECTQSQPESLGKSFQFLLEVYGRPGIPHVLCVVFWDRFMRGILSLAPLPLSKTRLTAPC